MKEPAMPDLPGPVDDPRQQLRAQWRRHADAVFDRLFPEDPDAPLPDFDQLEGRAEQLADDLACWLLQQRLDAPPPARPPTAPARPRCGRPGRPLHPRHHPLPRPAPPPSVTSNCAARSATAAAAGFFFPLDEALHLSQEGYSPKLLRRIVRQGSKTSFGEASADLEALAGIAISPSHVQRLCERI